MVQDGFAKEGSEPELLLLYGESEPGAGTFLPLRSRGWVVKGTIVRNGALTNYPLRIGGTIMLKECWDALVSCKKVRLAGWGSGAHLLWGRKEQEGDTDLWKDVGDCRSAVNAQRPLQEGGSEY